MFPSPSRGVEVASPVGAEAPPAVLIRLAEWRDDVHEVEPGVTRSGFGYREDMTLSELVDSTRAWWRISPARVEAEGVRYAVAVYRGVTRAVMSIGDWIPGWDGRWGFVATPITDGPVHEAWVGRSGKTVSFPKGSQNPITYWLPD